MGTTAYQEPHPIFRLCTTLHTYPQLLIYCLESPEHLLTKVLEKGQGEGGAAEALRPVVKNTHLQYTGQDEGLGTGWKGQTGQPQEDSCGHRQGQSWNAHSLWTPWTHARGTGIKGVQDQDLSYMTQHLVLCVCGSLNRSLCLGRYFSR